MVLDQFRRSIGGMMIVKKWRWVNFSCEQMYDLVNDIDQYDKFLPYCSKSTVLYRDNDNLRATLVITAAGISKSFTTLNRLHTNKMIEIGLINGPFSHLQGLWHFDDVDSGCKITFDLEFEFTSRMLAMLLGPMFEQVTNKMVDAFCERAQVLYDKR
jgi:ribosome-associated toxin RatA of RatAB toxin-antitoxin module